MVYFFYTFVKFTIIIQNIITSIPAISPYKDIFVKFVNITTNDVR